MTYATIDDLKTVVSARDLIQLTDLDGTAGAIVDAKLTNALQDASAEIDGYISKRVTLPLADPPRMLIVQCRDLAVYRLHSNAGRIPESVEKLREGAISYLKDVAAGKLSIGDETSGEEIETSPGAVLIEGAARTMTRDSLKRF